MNPVVISALAAVGGSSVGALTPVLSNYVVQRSLTQRDVLNRQIVQRETLYSDFIMEGSRLYASSMTHNLETLDELVTIYALVSRIRLLASEPVLRAAEEFVKEIMRHYGDRNMDVEEIRAAVVAARADPLDVFSLACRKELLEIFQRGTASSIIRR